MHKQTEDGITNPLRTSSKSRATVSISFDPLMEQPTPFKRIEYNYTEGADSLGDLFLSGGLGYRSHKPDNPLCVLALGNIAFDVPQRIMGRVKHHCIDNYNI